MLSVGHEQNTASLFSNKQGCNLLRQVKKNASGAQLITQPRLLLRTLSCRVLKYKTAASLFEIN